MHESDGFDSRDCQCCDHGIVEDIALIRRQCEMCSFEVSSDTLRRGRLIFLHVTMERELTMLEHVRVAIQRPRTHQPQLRARREARTVVSYY
jgi:hypothetical protein